MTSTTHEIDAPLSSDMATLKTRLKGMWMSGDYGHFATYLEPGALDFLARLNVAHGTRMLDVACGAGQIAIPAARAGAHVTGIDIAANSIEQARVRARAEGLDARFDEGDAEMIPFKDGSFDLVVSLIGAMFAPRPERVAAELVRVCKPGGRIVMANWTAEGIFGQMSRTIYKHVQPPPLMAIPTEWGDIATVKQRLSEGVAKLDMTKRMYPIHYPFAPAEVVELFRKYYGPTNRAYAALDEAGQKDLRRDQEQHLQSINLATDGTTRVEAEYLEVVAIRS